MEAKEFIGLSKKRAQNVAEERNLIFRLIRNGEEKFFDYPEDKRSDRLCVEIDDGKVSKAVIQ